MNPGLAFSLSIILAVIIMMLVVHKTPSKALSWWRDAKNKNIKMGIKVFCGVGIVLGLLVAAVKAEASESDFKWFDYGEVYLGMDYPMFGRVSPQCEEDGVNDKWTSNGGGRANIFVYRKIWHLNLKYTHHSCGFNEDRNLYDAGGFETAIRIW